VAAHYVPGGSTAINGGEPTQIAEVAEAFIAAFPDIEVVMDDLVLRDEGSVEYRWTFTGTSGDGVSSIRSPKVANRSRESLRRESLTPFSRQRRAIRFQACSSRSDQVPRVRMPRRTK
jgi:hypothetical protein